LNRPILNGINCQIKQGEFVVLLGLNGAGKSTLLRSLVGLIPIVKGEIRINDVAVTPRTFILGLVFVAATGLGVPAGTLALGIYTIGYLAKFYQQAIEAVDPRSLESLQVMGASRLEIAQYGILPQVLPLKLGYTLWMFEYNIRAASVLGVVGAGGIGFQLKSYIDGFEYTEATTMMLVLLVVVTVIDAFSSQLRHRLDSM
jgi:phosphonate transport system permease protein